jgi:hypothetical protein
MILAIAGGTIGVASAIWGVFLGGFERSLEAALLTGGIKREVSLGWQVLLIYSLYTFTPPIIGIAGGILANSKTAVAGVLCLIGGILGLPYLFSQLATNNIFWGFLIPPPTLIIAGILLLLSTRQAKFENIQQE